MERERAIKKIELLKAVAIYSGSETAEALDMAVEALKKPEIVRCKDCIHYGKPEYGYTKGDCRFHTAWYPVDENDYCSKAQRRNDTH